MNATAETVSTETIFDGLDASESEMQQGASNAEANSTANAADTAKQPDTGAAAAAEPAKSGGSAADGKAGADKPEPVVPVARLTAERKHYQQELARRDERLEALQKEITSLKEAMQPKEQAPDFAEDPKGYVDRTQAANAERLKRLETQLEQQKQADETWKAQQRAQQEALAQIRAQEAEFAQSHPDYYAALEYARQVRAQQIRVFAPDADEAAIMGELTRQELATAFGLLQQGQSVAERAYAYAKTLGYSQKQAEAHAKADAGKVDATTQQRDDKGQFVKQTPEEQAALAQRKADAATLGSGASDAADVDVDDAADMFEAARSERWK